MKVLFNKQTIEIAVNTTLAQMLQKQGVEGEHIAVAINQVIIKRTNWEETILNDGDKILVIGAVKGG